MRDTIVLIDSAGRSFLPIGENNVVAYVFSTNEILYYSFILIVVFIGIILLIRHIKLKKAEKNKAVQNLSERELQVANLMKDGKKNKEIAEILYISLSTVKTHINNIYKKLDIKDRKDINKFKFP